MKLNSLTSRSSLLFTAFASFALSFAAFSAQAQSNPDSAAAASPATAAATTASSAQAPGAQSPAVPARITQAIDETQLVRLRGNVHLLARPEFDQGAVPDSTPMNRMLLLLQRSPEQETALLQLMDQQQSKDSPNFHQWLTPQQFGKQFGPADADIQTVTDWLTSRGFQGIKIANGRTVIEFSGNVGQVRSAFHAEIHRFNVHGEARQANVSDPQIPAALTPVVAGIVTLHNFPRKSFKHDAGIHQVRGDGHGTPQFTSSGSYLVGPADFAKIYNIPTTLDGTNVTIGIVGDSNINPQDAIDFRNFFAVTPATAPTIIIDGPDPGISGPLGDEGEADLDVEISGMVAPKATIDFATAESTLTASGVDLAAFRLIDYNLVDVMSESFGTCEPGLGSTGVAFYSTVWEQAAAQGITVMVSTGDGGSAGCDNFNAQAFAVGGLAVNGVASSAFNVAVGGTDFDDVGRQTTFWSATNAAGTKESALGYIPETTWNDSCAATATSSTLNTVCASATNIVGGSGGPSAFNAKPVWQSTFGDATHRDLPDVSLFASNGPATNSFYPLCEADATGGQPSCQTTGASVIGGAGGTSASSPAFAGIMALINQKLGGRQGNANYVLYKLAQTAASSCNSSTQPLSPPATCVFYDVTKGNNSVPCAGGTTNCSSNSGATNGVLVDPANTNTPAWSTKTGYDLATGLGSVNVANLATAWSTAATGFKATTNALLLNGGSGTLTITHGTSVAAKATVTVVSPATGTPTGDVSLVEPQGTINSGVSDGTLAGGTVTMNTIYLPGGSYSVTADYTGDGTFAPSVSNAVPVIVNKENSRLQMALVALNPATGAIVNPSVTAFPYGTWTVLRFDILNSTANPCQSLVLNGNLTGCAFDAQGSVTATDGANALPGGPFNVNSSGSVEDQSLQLAPGVHTLSATYSGDVSYNAVIAPVTSGVTVSMGPTVATVSSNLVSVPANSPITFTASLATQSISSQGPTGTVTFFSSGMQIGSPAAVLPAGGAPTVGFATGTASLTTSFSSSGSKSITAMYNGDTNYAASPTSAAITVTVTSVGSFTLSGSAPPPIPAGNSGNSTITVQPSGGFTGPVQVSCPAPLPPGVTCSPLTITVPSTNTGQAVMGTLTVNVTAPSAAMATASLFPANRDFYVAGMIAPPSHGKGWWGLSALTGLGALVLLFLPGRKRYRAALGLGLVCILSFTLGCGSYGGGGGGPVATVTHFTVTSPTKAGANATFTFTATVTGGTPTDQVQLLDNGVATGLPVTVSGGTAMLTTSALSVVGTHSISAQYLGDATYTLPSTSGTLFVTVTGTTSFAITSSPTPSAMPAPINITIN